MAVKRYALIDLGAQALATHPIRYICDTTAELPTSGLKRGDTALAKDTNVQYKAVNATTWAVIGSSAPLPPPDPTFGPTPTSQSVRDSTGPNVVTDPGGGTTFTSRADLQSKINAGGSNAIYVAAANTTYTWDAQVTDGGKHPRIYFLGNPETTVLDGGGSTTYPGFDCSSSGGEIHGGRFYRMGQGIRARAGWTVTDAIMDTNFSIGISGQANSGSFTFQRIIARHNGQYGVTSTQDSVNTWGPTGCLFEDIEIDDNNTRHLDIGNSAGGTKFSAGTRNSTWRRMWAHDNYGAGVWWDGYHSGNLIEDIVSEDNRNWGVFLELGYGSTTARRMHLLNNANAGGGEDWFSNVQLLVSCTNGSLVANTAGSHGSGAAGGTGLIIRDSIIDGSQRAMGVITHDSHPIETKLISFLHNQVWLRRTTTPPNPSGQVGGQDTDTNQVLWTENITFDQNEYHAGNVTLPYWKWDSGSGQGAAKTWTEWRALGKDANSTLVVI